MTTTTMTHTTSGATVAASRAPFLSVALLQAGRLGTPETRDLAHQMLVGIDSLGPEGFYSLSGRLEVLYARSPQARAEAAERSDRWASEDRERRCQADRVALGVGAGAREGQTWL